MKSFYYVLLIVLVVTSFSACGHAKPRPAYISGTLYDMDGSTILPHEKLLFYVDEKTPLTDCMGQEFGSFWVPQLVTEVETDESGRFSVVTHAGRNSIILVGNGNKLYKLAFLELAAREQENLVLIRTEKLFSFPRVP